MVEHAEHTARSENAGSAADPVIQCRNCQYFRPEPWETGYCRHTHMFVLETFACDKFIRVAVADASAADASDRSESPVTTMTTA